MVRFAQRGAVDMLFFEMMAGKNVCACVLESIRTSRRTFHIVVGVVGVVVVVVVVLVTSETRRGHMETMLDQLSGRLDDFQGRRCAAGRQQRQTRGQRIDADHLDHGAAGAAQRGRGQRRRWPKCLANVVDRQFG